MHLSKAHIKPENTIAARTQATLNKKELLVSQLYLSTGKQKVLHPNTDPS